MEPFQNEKEVLRRFHNSMRRGEGTPPYGDAESEQQFSKNQTQEIQSILAGLDFG